MPVQIGKEIKGNRPDIAVKDKKERNCKLIDASVPTERNISIKMTEKLSKYKYLEIEFERIWGMETITIPVIIGTFGLVKKEWKVISVKSLGISRYKKLKSVSSSALLIL